MTNQQHVKNLFYIYKDHSVEDIPSDVPKILKESPILSNVLDKLYFDYNIRNAFKEKRKLCHNFIKKYLIDNKLVDISKYQIIIHIDLLRYKYIEFIFDVFLNSILQEVIDNELTQNEQKKIKKIIYTLCDESSQEKWLNTPDERWLSDLNYSLGSEEYDKLLKLLDWQIPIGEIKNKYE